MNQISLKCPDVYLGFACSELDYIVRSTKQNNLVVLFDALLTHPNRLVINANHLEALNHLFRLIQTVTQSHCSPC